MVDLPHGGFADIYREYITTGVPSSGKHRPIKSQIRAHGAVLEQGLFGNAFSIDPAVTNLNAITGPGKYAVNTATYTNRPTDLLGILEVERRSNARIIQTYTVVHTTTAEITNRYTRGSTDSGTNWSAWVADIEKYGDSVAGGVRFLSGDQLEWKRLDNLGPIDIGLGSGAQSGVISAGNWVKAFANRPRISMMCGKAGGSSNSLISQYTQHGTTSAGSYQLLRINGTSSATDFFIELLAMGRWF